MFRHSDIPKMINHLIMRKALRPQWVKIYSVNKKKNKNGMTKLYLPDLVLRIKKFYEIEKKNPPTGINTKSLTNLYMTPNGVVYSPAANPVAALLIKYTGDYFKHQPGLFKDETNSFSLGSNPNFTVEIGEGFILVYNTVGMVLQDTTTILPNLGRGQKIMINYGIACDWNGDVSPVHYSRPYEIRWTRAPSTVRETSQLIFNQSGTTTPVMLNDWQNLNMTWNEMITGDTL